MSNNLYEQELWDKGYKEFDFFVAEESDPVRQFLLENIPPIPGEAFEVGCFPGRYLALLGELGWELSGIDQTIHLRDMENWFASKNYKIGNFQRENFEKIFSNQKFDLVCSFGFIEHFTNWQDIIVQHLKLVKQGGKVIITTPNFTGGQGLLHRFLDKNNYDMHNPKSMVPYKWKEILEQNGFEIHKAGYFGRFAFWYGWQPRPYYKRFVLYRFMKVVPLLRKIIFFNTKILSPFCGIAATKR